jgi:hypothetical protein
MRHLTSSSFPRTPSADETLDSLDFRSNQQRHNVAYGGRIDCVQHILSEVVSAMLAAVTSPVKERSAL